MKMMPRVNRGENKKRLSGELHKLFRSGIFEHFPGQLVPMPNYPSGEEIFTTSNLNLLWSNMWLFAHVLLLATWEKRPALIQLQPSFKWL